VGLLLVDDVLISLVQDADLRERLAKNVRAMDVVEQSWISIAKKTLEALGALCVLLPVPRFRLRDLKLSCL